ncbi:WecB/TagA/CpsF family glycosyltransferase [Clostridium sp. YIM B02551]|uniref:WecB/TagA/CpsF family glycosyltransferase n=1 Tax=Clostridium sp. YIM B02551 TaxID=2910679 RepID=UPI001EEB6A0C
MLKTVKLFDCDVAALTMGETINEIEKLIELRIPSQHVVLNAGKVVLMQSNSKLKEIIKSCKIINADGQSIVWASKLLKKKLPERVTGIDLMEELIKLSEMKGYGIYFFGAKQEIVQDVVKIYKNKYPLLKIAGYRNGYFTEKDMPEIINDMKSSKADILLVAFSSPNKEYWLSENINKIEIPFCMGVGGSFDVVSGVTKRAPIWMQKVGLEWFYRFVQEPGRMWKRYLVGNSKFVSIVMKELLNHK